jgi:hypothetical protein
MSKIILLLALTLIVTPAFSQKRGVELSHYIFPEFIKGTIVMKAGGKNVTMLNYNSMTEEMIFENNGKKLALGMIELIDTIYIDGRIFLPFEKKFIEIVYRNKYELDAIHKCSVVDPGKPAAYGGTSQTSSTTSYSSIFSGGQAYELSLPDGFKTKPYTDYLLKKDGKLTTFLNLRQLSKQFDEKSDLFKKYVKENKVNYENQESLIGLIKFLEAN